MSVICGFLHWDAQRELCNSKYSKPPALCDLCACVLSHFSHVWLFAALWIVFHQTPLSVGFFRQEYWKWVIVFSSSGSSWPGDWTCVSCIAGRFFTNWATRENAGKEWRQKEKGAERTRWLDSITDSMDISLSKLLEIVKDMETWHAAIHGVTKSPTQLSQPLKNNNVLSIAWGILILKNYYWSDIQIYWASIFFFFLPFFSYFFFPSSLLPFPPHPPTPYSHFQNLKTLQRNGWRTNRCTDGKSQIVGTVRENSAPKLFISQMFLIHEAGHWVKEFRCKPLGQGGMTEELWAKMWEHEIVICG